MWFLGSPQFFIGDRPGVVAMACHSTRAILSENRKPQLETYKTSHQAPYPKLGPRVLPGGPVQSLCFPCWDIKGLILGLQNPTCCATCTPNNKQKTLHPTFISKKTFKSMTSPQEHASQRFSFIPLQRGEEETQEEAPGISPSPYSMNVKCPGQYTIITTFSHTVVQCIGCSIVWPAYRRNSLESVLL